MSRLPKVQQDIPENVTYIDDRITTYCKLMQIIDSFCAIKKDQLRTLFMPTSQDYWTTKGYTKTGWYAAKHQSMGL